MGVTVHHICFDPKVHTAPISLDTWVLAGLLDKNLEVTEAGSHSLHVIDSMFENNKMWYRNLDASWAWDLARKRVNASVVEGFDHWFSHLFFQELNDLCQTSPVSAKGEGEVIYDASWIAHVCDLERELGDVLSVLDSLNKSDVDFQRAKESAKYPWMFDAEGFASLVHIWMRLIHRAQKQRPGWSLLQWVWL